VKAFQLAVERAFLRYIEVPGQGPPLVWVHGLMCSSTGELFPTAVQEPLWGRRSLLVDFLGYGYSDRPAAFGYALEDHARTIVALLDGLGIPRCVVIGHSMGGAVAALVAAVRPKIVSTLIVAEPALGDPLGEFEFASQSEDESVTR
jgi:pimeloyl-ACP methyl ester carboxylesterase